MPSTTSAPRIVELAATISDSVAKLQDRLDAKKLPSPSLDEDDGFVCPPEGSDAKDAVIDAASELIDMLLDPVTFTWQHCVRNETTCFQAIGRLHIPELIPPGGEISFEEIAQKTGLDEQSTAHILRQAVVLRILREPRRGFVAHTRVSKYFVLNPSLNDAVNLAAQEVWPAAIKALDAIQKWPGSQEANETGFSLANNTTQNIYEVLGASPGRAAQFARSMQALSGGPAFASDYTISSYDWAALGPCKVVDVGGSRGHISFALAQEFDNLTFVIQDLPQVLEDADSGVPDKLKDRITFQGQSFFEPQPVVADVYLMRAIIHNWSDKYAANILKSQVPALRPGARILIHDACMPEPGEMAAWRERDLRGLSAVEAAVFNAYERTAEEFERLLSQADPRFALQKVFMPKGSTMSMLEVRWNGTE